MSNNYLNGFVFMSILFYPSINQKGLLLNLIFQLIKLKMMLFCTTSFWCLLF